MGNLRRENQEGKNALHLLSHRRHSRVRSILISFLRWGGSKLRSPFWKILLEKFQGDNALFLARGLAFDVLVCLIPAVFLLFVLFGFLFDSPQETQQYLTTYMKAMIPFSTQQVLRNLFAVVKAKKVFGIIGGIGLLWTLSRLFGSIRTVLDSVMEVEEGRGILQGKLFDLKMMFLGSLFFLATFLITSVTSLLKKVGPKVLGAKVLYLGMRGEFISLLLAFVFTVGMFFFLYRFVPYQRMGTKAAFCAALAASSLWELAKQGFRVYLLHVTDLNSVYGSFTLLFAVAFWVYYSCIVFILGAEMGWIWEKNQTDKSGG